jgi:hypothetical protein
VRIKPNVSQRTPTRYQTLKPSIVKESEPGCPKGTHHCHASGGVIGPKAARHVGAHEANGMRGASVERRDDWGGGKSSEGSQPHERYRHETRPEGSTGRVKRQEGEKP